MEKDFTRAVQVGELVALEGNNLIMKVFEVRGSLVTIGYDRTDKNFRTKVPLDQITPALGHLYKLASQGHPL